MRLAWRWLGQWPGVGEVKVPSRAARRRKWPVWRVLGGDVDVGVGVEVIMVDCGSWTEGVSGLQM